MKTRLSLMVSCVAISLALSAAAAPKSFKVGEFTFTVPEKWEWVETPSASMRKAQLKVAGADKKEAAEVVFFHFGPGNGGGTQANVERWYGQFKEPKDQIKAKTETATIQNHKVTFVQAQGTYMSGMPGGPKTEQPNSMLLGAIMESAEGSVFIRMTGPVELVKTSNDAFRKMVESGLKKP